MDRDVLLEALGVMCNANVTSVQKQKLQTDSVSGDGSKQMLTTKVLLSSVQQGEQTCRVAKCNFTRILTDMQGGQARSVLLHSDDLSTEFDESQKQNIIHILDEDEFFDRGYDYDYTNVTDKKTYFRGGEKYERPCGWMRFAIKVLDKYCDNTWLGPVGRGTQSSPGEWPVSYHGTSSGGAEGIIEGHYKPGPGQVYGRGIYSSPDFDVGIQYAKKFQSKKTGKWYKVILQNRINPQYRQKFGNYWLISIPAGTAAEREEELVERAIRPYGLLLKEV